MIFVFLVVVTNIVFHGSWIVGVCTGDLRWLWGMTVIVPFGLALCWDMEKADDPRIHLEETGDVGPSGLPIYRNVGIRERRRRATGRRWV